MAPARSCFATFRASTSLMSYEAMDKPAWSPVATDNLVQNDGPIQAGHAGGDGGVIHTWPGPLLTGCPRAWQLP
jgi:hypothetical protein